MLRFEFDTSDLPEEEKEFYHNISLEFSHGQDFDVEEITERFKSFLLAMTFPQSVVNKVIVDGDYATVNKNTIYPANNINKNHLKSFMEGSLDAANKKRD